MRRLFRYIAVPIALLAPVILLVVLASVAEAAGQVVVAKRTIYPGQRIEAHDLKIVALRKKIGVAYRVAQHPEELIGQVAKRTILPGRYIAVKSVRSEYTVKAGTPVRVMFRSGSLAISLVGIPLSSGTAGQTIRIRNSSSGKVFSGLILDDGSIMAGAI